ncbi:Uncharacterised protein [Vibrio cholerae]|nr:Uncharacterised protein [Vibrio cholerae]
MPAPHVPSWIRYRDSGAPNYAKFLQKDVF